MCAVPSQLATSPCPWVGLDPVLRLRFAFFGLSPPCFDASLAPPSSPRLPPPNPPRLLQHRGAAAPRGAQAPASADHFPGPGPLRGCRCLRTQRGVRSRAPVCLWRVHGQPVPRAQSQARDTLPGPVRGPSLFSAMLWSNLSLVRMFHSLATLSVAHSIPPPFSSNLAIFCVSLDTLRAQPVGRPSTRTFTIQPYLGSAKPTTILVRK